MTITKISGIEKGELDAIARKRLLSALDYNLPRSDLEEVIESAYEKYCERRDKKESGNEDKRTRYMDGEPIPLYGEMVEDIPQTDKEEDKKDEIGDNELCPRCGEVMEEGHGTYQKGYLVCNRCSYGK